MERMCSLRGQTLTTMPTSLTSLSGQGFDPQGCKNGQFVRFSSLKNHSSFGKFMFLNLRFRASGPINASSQAVEAKPKNSDPKDQNLVFVAGATGKVGSRTVRELLKLGFRVRAGVRSAQRVESLVRSVKELKLPNVDEGTQAVEKLEIVECDLEKKDLIQPALGSASTVICCIGASEKEIFDITGPYRIDYQATKNLIDAAKAVKADQFLLLTSLGTNKFGFPAAILNLFWGVLCWKRKAEEALIASDLPYAIVRPGGMERPTDAYKETHNLTLSTEDTLFGGQVSNLQVAELLACMAKNPKLSYCKIVEAIAETTVPLTPIEELLQKIPSKHPYVPPPTTESSPPSSSTSTAETTSVASGVVETKPEPQKPRPLSPYAVYEDLKPPTSPTPTSSGPQGAASAENVSELLGGNDAAVTTTETAVDSQSNSPFSVYEDLKPPTSPSPSSATPSSVSNLTDNNVSETPPISAGDSSAQSPPANQDQVTQASSKPRPLSPYTMYEEMKPPTSPIPSTSANH